MSDWDTFSSNLFWNHLSFSNKEKYYSFERFEIILILPKEVMIHRLMVAEMKNLFIAADFEILA